MNPYRTLRERAAYEAGLAAGREKQGGEGKVLTRQQVLAMSTDEINARWPEVQRSMAAGLPSGDDDD